jgi:hypothetical protein
MQVYVILFNARTDNEGIHTYRVADRHIVLMFEAEDDATRFALMLEAQDFPPATVESMAEEDIRGFCDTAKYECRLVPEGSLVTPPEQNVERTTWSPDGQETDGPAPTAEPEQAGSSADAEIERMRQQLERLL